MYAPPSFPVLLHAVCAGAREELCGVGVAEGGGVEERRAAVVVDSVDVGAAQRDERLEAVVVAAGGRTVQRSEAVLHSVRSSHSHINQTEFNQISPLFGRTDTFAGLRLILPRSKLPVR